MMRKKKYIALFSIILFINLQLKGQDSCSINVICEKYINLARVNTYKTIILSKELQSNSKCHIVTIQPVSLNIKYDGYRYYDIEQTKDSISIDRLRKELSPTYWVYEVNKPLINISHGNDYINYFIRQDSTYIPKYFEDEVCNNNFDIIKIYEPLDKWVNLYRANFESKISEVIIPVQYEAVNSGLTKNTKSLLFQVKLGAGGGIISEKVVEIE